MSCGVEIHAVDDPLEKRIGVGDGAQMGRAHKLARRRRKGERLSPGKYRPLSPMRETRAATARRLLLRRCSGCFRIEVAGQRASMIAIRRGLRPSAGATPSSAKRPFRNWLSGVQLIEQRLSFFQIERVEA